MEPLLENNSTDQEESDLEFNLIKEALLSHLKEQEIREEEERRRIRNQYKELGISDEEERRRIRNRDKKRRRKINREKEEQRILNQEKEEQRILNQEEERRRIRNREKEEQRKLNREKEKQRILNRSQRLQEKEEQRILNWITGFRRRFQGKAPCGNRSISHPNIQPSPQSLNVTEAEYDPEDPYPEYVSEDPNSSGADAEAENDSETVNGSELGTEAAHSKRNIPGFFESTFNSVITLTPGIRRTLLTFGFAAVSYQANNLNAKFDSKSGNMVSDMSFGEATAELLSYMKEGVLLMTSTLLSLLLVLPLSIIEQMIFMGMLIFGPFHDIPELALKVASTGVDVVCGSIKLPLFWFTLSGTLVPFFILILVLLVWFYLIFKLCIKR